MKLKNLQEIDLIDLTSEKLIHYIELNLRNNIIIVFYIFFFVKFLNKVFRLLWVTI